MQARLRLPNRPKIAHSAEKGKTQFTKRKKMRKMDWTKGWQKRSTLRLGDTRRARKTRQKRQPTGQKTGKMTGQRHQTHRAKNQAKPCRKNPKKQTNPPQDRAKILQKWPEQQKQPTEKKTGQRGKRDSRPGKKNCYFPGSFCQCSARFFLISFLPFCRSFARWVGAFARSFLQGLPAPLPGPDLGWCFCPVSFVRHFARCFARWVGVLPGHFCLAGWCRPFCPVFCPVGCLFCFVISAGFCPLILARSLLCGGLVLLSGHFCPSFAWWVGAFARSFLRCGLVPLARFFAWAFAWWVAFFCPVLFFAFFFARWVCFCLVISAGFCPVFVLLPSHACRVLPCPLPGGLVLCWRYCPAIPEPSYGSAF